MARRCERCGASIKDAHKGARYCSRTCANRANGDSRVAAADKPSRVCPQCGGSKRAGARVCFSCYSANRHAAADVKPARGVCADCGASTYAKGTRCRICWRTWKPVSGKQYATKRAVKDALERVQDGRCAICRVPFGEVVRPHLDHDARTGMVRGALCLQCNTGLGNLGDSPERLIAAAEYLRANFSGLGIEWLDRGEGKLCRLPSPDPEWLANIGKGA